MATFRGCLLIRMHLTFTTALGGRCSYFPHFTEEEGEAQSSAWASARSQKARGEAAAPESHRESCAASDAGNPGAAERQPPHGAPEPCSASPRPP